MHGRFDCFFHWLSSHSGAPDPFADLEPPEKPRQEADWLTQQEFARLLAAAEAPVRRRAGLARRDRLVLLALVATGLRRSELIALNWGDVELDSDHPSALVRRGKGGRPCRQHSRRRWPPSSPSTSVTPTFRPSAATRT